MKNYIFTPSLIFILISCSTISGPDGYFPDKKNDFFEEKIDKSIEIPEDLSSIDTENHYPVLENVNVIDEFNLPKPRQIFASSGNSSVQIRRLGELLWIYVETLPSTSWPISKSYWDTSSFDVIEANPETGIILVDYANEMHIQMKVEHGIKEASTEIFLNQVNKSTGSIENDPELIQLELEKIVDYFANSVSSFSGTSLAAQNLNDMKKARIFSEKGTTVIELDLAFNRAWSSVSRALTAADITTNDKNRDEGIFYVSYKEVDSRRFFGLFGGSSNQPNSNALNITDEAEFQIRIIEKNNKSYVRAFAKNGNIEDTEKLISIINESLS
tara:strand:+ start:909 stop:1895 length:987 start_codon:yes stop_codon:yes gene_type:complete